MTKLPFFKPAEDSAETELHAGAPQAARRLPAQPAQRRATAGVPALEAFQGLLDGTDDREISTTMVFVRILTTLLRDKNIGRNIVPIVPDEARTFGMEGMFRQIGIYSSVGQLYTPQDAEQLMYYREDKKGQILEEGINEAGAFCSWLAAGTAYANHGVYMVPFYIFYSMFGFQRIGDFIWAAGDMQHAASCSAPRRAAPRWRARACSTRTATASCSRRRSRTAWPTTRPTPTSSP